MVQAKQRERLDRLDNILDVMYQTNERQVKDGGEKVYLGGVTKWKGET